jgi:hypothetical protein
MLAYPVITFLLHSRPAALGYCPRHAAAMLKMVIRRVDNRVHFVNRYITLHNLKDMACR